MSPGGWEPDALSAFVVASTGLGLLLVLLCIACIIYIQRLRSAPKVNPTYGEHPLERAREARLKAAFERVVELEKRATATVEKVQKLVVTLESQTLARAAE